MHKSSFLEELQKRTLSLPLAMQNLSHLTIQQRKGERHKDEPFLKETFPHLGHQEVVEFVENGKQKKQTPLRIGAVFSGGPAPGGHNVLAGLLSALLMQNKDSRLIGFLNGPKGILENNMRELSPSLVESYRNTGGFDLIGSGRTKIETQEQFEQALKTVTDQKLDGLVIIGGDDSNTNAALLAEFFLSKQCKTRVIGVPKTIDGDLKGGGLKSLLVLIPLAEPTLN